ncbi:Trypsin [Popillia japonica]|uniref:Trypsin n=1 Tax=Popillia japonica TaxID=7064 RepID=A0AAW1JID8_POPJA
MIILHSSAYKRIRYDKQGLDPKIIGGTDAKIEDFPFMVRIEIHEGGAFLICGASYIKPTWVLTAAHCIDANDGDISLPPSVPSQEDMVICIMEKDDAKQIKYQIGQSKKLIIHPGYFRNHTSVANDLGLILLQNPFSITTKAKIGKLIDTEIDYSGASVFIIGWGATKVTDTPANITQPRKLQMLKTVVHNMDECRRRTRSKATICIGKEGGISCSGDSGSPLVYNNMVIGVCSYGFGCSGETAVYGNVYNHLDWIKEVTEGCRKDLIIAKGKRKKRAYIIGGITALIVLGLVIALVVVLTSKSNESEVPAVVESPVTLENFLEGKLSPKSFNASWTSNHALFYRDETGSIVLYNVATNSTDIVLPHTWTYLMNGFNYQLSPDEKYMMIARDYQKLYRHTYSARYTVVDLSSRLELKLGGEDAVLQYSTWAPTGNGVAFVSNNNIYYKSDAFEGDLVNVTTDGKEGHIYNGVPDWVYEEEVFGSDHAMWFSENGRKLAYIKFDDESIDTMTIPYYGIPGSLDSQYTKIVNIRYPKPGTANPKVSLHVYNAEARTTMNLDTPTGLNDPIISTVSWATNEILVVTWLNRVQNEAFLVSYDTTSFASASTYQLISHIKQENGWLEMFTPPVFSKDGSQLLLILSHDQGGDAGSYRHITRYNVAANSAGVALTSGKFVVTEILGWNDDTIYYLANTPADPAVQHFYSLSVTSSESTCISCDIKTSAKGEDYFSYYVFNCAGPGFPEISLFNANHEKLMVWEDNADLIEMLDKEHSMPKIQRLEFNISDEFKAQVLLKLPPNMDLSGNTKYPMVVNVYGGPDSYQVLEKFSVDWGSYLAVNKSIIYATIDGRLSGLKGDKILFSGYRNLGTVEVEDQISVTQQIQQTVPYVDGTRTAIWGWSYGGYAAGLALATDTKSIFKCAMSVAPITDWTLYVAPITDWTLYDSIYTERFMGLPTPDDNGEGYDNAKLLTRFEGIRDKEYFLIHGTFDDNVHYQQSMLWSKVLEHQDVLFRQQSYTDEDHSLASVRPHLYHSLENFLDECFIENVQN